MWRKKTGGALAGVFDDDAVVDAAILRQKLNNSSKKKKDVNEGKEIKRKKNTKV